MKRSMIKPPSNRWMRHTLAAMAVVGAVGTCVWAEQISVTRNQVKVLKGKSSTYLPPLATAVKGDTLEVVGHEGHWLKVQYKGVEGYVLDTSLTAPDVNTSKAAAGAGGPNDVSAAAAAKGFDSDAWAKGHGFSLDGLNKMLATQARIAGDPCVKFKQDGNVGVR